MSPWFGEGVRLLQIVEHFRGRVDLTHLVDVGQDRNTDGLLTPDEREELAALAELSETLALVRAQALRLLGRGPG